ncbi:ATP-binding protein [Limnothrix redekei LRLZ20PSL1]|uniref:histidine kinase n=1 Tax=Limnothrix redekei LRLZ20PSL1 TaxID=3112953 RepID=A0ABW7CC38_9CYAN
MQQAAYSLIARDQKQSTHLSIGRLLLESTSIETLEYSIFDIVNHWNQALDLILSSEADRMSLIHLDILAGRKAKNSIAYDAALGYLKISISLLPPNVWSSQYNLALDLYSLAGETAYLSGDFILMERWLSVLLNQTTSVLDQIDAYQTKIQAYTAQTKQQEVVNLALQVLEKLGINCPEKPSPEAVDQSFTELQTKIFRLVNNSIETLSQLSRMTDRKWLAVVQVLQCAVPTIYQINAPLFQIMVFKLIDLSLDYGNTAFSSFGYACYGLLLCDKNQIENGYQFGHLAAILAEQFNDRKIQVRTMFCVSVFINVWRDHIDDVVALLKNVHQWGIEQGELEFSGYAMFHYSFCSYFSGINLSSLKEQLADGVEILKSLNQDSAMNWTQFYLESILSLLQEKHVNTPKVQSDRANTLERLGQQQDFHGLFHALLNHGSLFFLMGYISESQEALQHAEKHLDAVTGNIALSIFTFYDYLAKVASYFDLNSSDQSSMLKTLNNRKLSMQQWAIHAPNNYQHKFHLMEAEYCRILGEFYKAIEYYDLAIVGAKENRYLQEEALANELAAKFYLDWGKDKIAAIHMQEAYYCYSRWGAKAKVADLEERYPQLLQPVLQATSQRLTILDTLSSLATPAYSIHSIPRTHSSSNINHTLDLSTLLQISQTFASTIALDELLQTLAQTMLENSGADRCALMLCEENQWQVRVMADLERVTLQSAPLDNNLTVPVKLIQYVKNTATTVMVDDLKTDLPVIGDYLKQYQPKSVLCLPILNQGKLRAILYLENHSTSDVFTSDRIAVLNFLCIQAAISLENASLYQKAQLYAQQAQLYAQQLEQSQLQMVQSEKMASLGNLVAGVAHEINNPIGFLNGSINNGKEHVRDLLEHLALYQQHYPSPTSPIQDHAEDIDLEYVCEDLPQLLNSMQGATDRIKSISTSLRTFSRADTEYKVSANLHEGIDSTLLILKYRLKANANRPAIEVITNYGEIPLIDCFPGQLNQVFMNILANAIDMFDEIAQGRSFKELEAHPQQITISTTLVNDQVQITIRDNGKGMNAEVQSRIFDHLFTTKSVGKGTGLGLAIAQQIVVDKHSGSLTVESEPGQGAAFRIQLPIKG